MTLKKRQRTEKSKYKHQSTGDFCTCAAYIAEIMCMRNAEFKNQGSLPYKFWNCKPWDWTFKHQVILARKLLKSYPEAAVVRAIHSPELKSVFSLNNKKVLPIVKKYAIIIEQERERIQTLDVVEQPKTRTQSHGRKSILSKLREIDGKREERKES